MKYVCENQECLDYGKEQEFYKTTSTFIGNDLVCLQSICSKCKSKMKNLTENVPLSEKNIQIGKIASMSKEDRNKVLKKRSTEHFKSNIKEKKDHLMNTAMKEMRGK